LHGIAVKAHFRQVPGGGYEPEKREARRMPRLFRFFSVKQVGSCSAMMMMMTLFVIFLKRSHNHHPAAYINKSSDINNLRISCKTNHLGTESALIVKV
ncbi:MAG: hypothetical protein WA672_20860, partial [Candidatus Angelobacter sp.]